jgi:hypothetical protein
MDTRDCAGEYLMESTEKEIIEKALERYLQGYH